MEVNINNTIDILEYVASKDIKDKIIVCESGMENTSYIKDLYKRGIKVFLIGSYFMQSKNLVHDLSDMEAKLKRENLI
jgi:indole-3-glycerol phosphate synthase